MLILLTLQFNGIHYTTFPKRLYHAPKDLALLALATTTAAASLANNIYIFVFLDDTQTSRKKDKNICINLYDQQSITIISPAIIMSFVSRLFSSSSSTSIAEVSLEQAHNNPSNSNGSVPKMNRASQPNGSILRQPSPPGARQQQQRRVSFSSDPVRVTTIPANPTRPSTMSHHNDHIIRALPPPAQNHQSFQPQPTTVNNNSWFRSFFGSSKLPISKSSSPSMVKNDQLPANSPIPSQHETFRPLNNSQLLENIPLDLTKSFNGNQLRLAWCKQKDDEPETALDAVENIDLISSQMEPENLNNLGII